MFTSTGQLLSRLRILQLVPCNRDAGNTFFHRILAYFGGPKNIYRVYHGHHNGSNGPIYINNIYICGHFDISDHMSSPLAMVRIIMGGSGPKSTASLWPFPFITDPVLPVAKKMPKSDLQKTGWFGFNPWFKKPPHLRFHRWVWSIPIDTFLVGWTSINPSYFGVHQGYQGFDPSPDHN